MEDSVEYNSCHCMQSHAQGHKVITYLLDLSSWIHGAKHMEEMVESHSDHTVGYTPCRLMRNE